ncbi:MAG: hypothetical protein IT195_12445 [Microthrixaceae bacterium]|nr:hypothetical protein [Microthrixaceae bacterium]
MTIPIGTGAGVEMLGDPPRPVGSGQAGGEHGTKTPNQVSVDRGQQQQRLRIARAHAGVAILRRLLRSWGHDEERTARCGYRLGSGDEGETWTLRNGRAELRGRERCASTKLCAVCHDKEALVRAAVVSVATHRWLEQDDNNWAAFWSITPGHSHKDRLDLAHDRLLEAREAVFNNRSRWWWTYRKRFGIRDVLWTVEHTVGVNGPHCQLHAVFLIHGIWDADTAQAAHTALWSKFRDELIRLGYSRRFSARSAIDLRPVHDTTGLAAYVAKVGIGAELAGLAGKDGRGEGSISYLEIPARLAELCGRRDPEKVARHDREVRRLVDALHEYADLVYSHRERGRRWWKSFHTTRRLVPELAELEAEGLRGSQLANGLLELLPAEIRPGAGGAEEQLPGPFDDDGTDQAPPAEQHEAGVLHVDSDSWQAAYEAYIQGRRDPNGIWRDAWHLVPDHHGLVDLTLVVGWLLEDHGLEHTADIIAGWAGAEAVESDIGWDVIWRAPPRRAA